jgi:hypothetical protein
MEGAQETIRVMEKLNLEAAHAALNAGREFGLKSPFLETGCLSVGALTDGAAGDPNGNLGADDSLHTTHTQIPTDLAPNVDRANQWPRPHPVGLFAPASAGPGTGGSCTSRAVTFPRTRPSGVSGVWWRRVVCEQGSFGVNY